MPTHHIPDDVLMEYATGASPQAVALAVACHISFCGLCRQNLDALEAVGGAILSDTLPRALSAGSLQQVLARLDGPAPAEKSLAQPASLPAGFDRWPAALRPYLGSGARWRLVVPGVRVVDLEIEKSRLRARVLRFRPGLVIPHHDHKGVEYTVIFSGGLADAGLQYHAGDVCVRQPGERHEQRVIEGHDCVALVINEGGLIPLTIKGHILKAITGE